MTAAELQERCAGYTLQPPCTVDDCAEILADLKPHTGGALLDVNATDDHTIVITVGVKPNQLRQTIRA